MSPPPAHEPFLRAICAAPEDDAPRLVFADWLDEAGDPDRAEFIRLHIQLARDPDAPGLAQRCEELFRQHWVRWEDELPGPPGLWAEYLDPQPPVLPLLFDGDQPAQLDTWADCRPSLGNWHRGFSATVYIHEFIDPLLSWTHWIAEFVPVWRLRMVNVHDPNAVVLCISRLPFLKKIRDLILPSVVLTDDAAVALANSPFASGLRQVSLEAERMTDRAGRAFAESPHLGGLEMLHLVHNDFNGSTKALLRARFGFNVHC